MLSECFNDDDNFEIKIDIEKNLIINILNFDLLLK